MQFCQLRHYRKDGIVTLRGPVENSLARERAAEIAATIKSVFCGSKKQK